MDGSENSKAIFTADCKALVAAAQRFGVTPTSIIFPRNQTTPEALEACREVGLKAYRGTESHFLYQARNETSQTNPFIRAMRLLDHYFNLSGNHTYRINSNVNITINSNIINLPASRFLRPYMSKLRWFEKLRLRRIKNAMTHAAQNGEVFHLWWHPHNFGTNRKENFSNLLELLEHFSYLKETYQMESKNMQELATLANEQTE